MRDFKKFVAQKEAPALGIRENPIWQSRYDRVAINTDKVLRVKLDYIHNNPVRAKIVQHPEDYLYSSARNYAGFESMFSVEVVTVKWKTIS